MKHVVSMSHVISNTFMIHCLFQLQAAPTYVYTDVSLSNNLASKSSYLEGESWNVSQNAIPHNSFF